MRLVFKNSLGDEKFLGRFETETQAFQCIGEFLEKHKYKSYYYNISHYDNYTLIDFGSWSEFFYLYEGDEDA